MAPVWHAGRPIILRQDEGSNFKRTEAAHAAGITQHATDEPGALGASAAAAGLQVLMAMPLLRDGKLLAVVGWYF